MPTLREIVRKRFLEECIRPCRQKCNNSQLVLILDERTTRIISSSLRMIDITREGISLTENLQISRKPFPDLHALYFITPSRASVERMCADFEGKNRMYFAVHLFLTTPLSPELERMVEEKLVRRGLVKTWVETYVDFLVPEARAVSFETPNALRLYSRVNKIDPPGIKSDSVAGLVSLLRTLGEFPTVRFGLETERAREIATAVLAELRTAKENFPETFKKSRDGESTLIILDRGYDAVCPLLHEFTYQAMAHDLLEIKKNTFELKESKRRRVVILDDQEEMWPQLRHLHISEAMDTLLRQFKEFAAQHEQIRQKARNLDKMSDMKDAIRSMPQLTSQKETFDAHLEMTKQCMERFSAQQLESIAEVEQDMATGKDKNGDLPKNLKGRLMGLLTIPTLSESVKYRLLLLYVATQGTEHREELCSAANLSESPLLHLSELGVVFKSKPQKENLLSKAKFWRKAEPNEPAYELSRYVPVLQSILEQLYDNTTTTTTTTTSSSSSAFDSKYPALNKPPPKPVEQATPAETGTSQRTRGIVPTWQKAKPVDKVEEDLGPRIVVFVVGGVTYSEMRIAYSFSQAKKRDVIVAGNTFLTPHDFVEGLKQMDN